MLQILLLVVGLVPQQPGDVLQNELAIEKSKKDGVFTCNNCGSNSECCSKHSECYFYNMSGQAGPACIFQPRQLLQKGQSKLKKRVILKISTKKNFDEDLSSKQDDDDPVNNPGPDANYDDNYYDNYY